MSQQEGASRLFAPALVLACLFLPHAAMAATIQSVSAPITFGSVALALAASLWAIGTVRAAARLRRNLWIANARARAAVAARDAIIENGSESILAWPASSSDSTWSYGQSEALLDSCLKGPDVLPLSQALDDLSNGGASFSLMVRDPDGNAVRIRGHVAGGLAVLRLQAEGSCPAAEQDRCPPVGGPVASAAQIGPTSEPAPPLYAELEAQRDTLDRLSTAVAVFDKDQRLSFYNRAFLELWDLPDEWLRERHSESELLDRLREEQKLPEQRDYRAWKQEHLGAYESRDRGIEEEQWHVSSGQTLRVLAQSHSFGGRTYFYEDVTEKLRLESSYNTLIGVQRATLDSLREGVAVFGLDGRLRLHNAAFSQLWRFEPVELSDEPHVQQLAALCVERFGESPAWRKLVETVASGRDRLHDWGYFERSDHLVLSVAQAPLPDGAMLVSFTDVTDRFRAEAALRERNQALLAADELKSEFVQHASFLFRNPLNAVLGFADMLAGGHAGALNVKQRDYVQSILAAAHKLAEITSDILDLSMIESGDMRLELARTDLHRLLSRAAEPFREHALSRDVAFRFDVPRDVGEAVLDERRIRQIVFNLLSNAVRYTPRGGDITFGARALPDEIQIFVSDSGPGIAVEVQPKVFGRFEAQGRSGQRGGAGLGLALVNSFVALHDGWVEIETSEGQGTLVRCHLPRRLPADSTSKPEDVHAA